MNKIYRFSGYCPHLKKRHTIDIEYDELNFSEDTRTYYRKIGYSCDYADDCKFAAENPTEGCPTYQAAPDEPS